jgi:hypothetical protein
MKETKIMTTEQLSKEEYKTFCDHFNTEDNGRVNAFLKDMHLVVLGVDKTHKCIDVVLKVEKDASKELKQVIDALHCFLEDLNKESNDADLVPADDEEKNKYFFIGIHGNHTHVEGTIHPIVVKAILDEVLKGLDEVSEG